MQLVHGGTLLTPISFTPRWGTVHQLTALNKLPGGMSGGTKAQVVIIAVFKIGILVN